MHALVHQLIQRHGLGAGRARRLWGLSGLHEPPAHWGRWLFRVLVVLAALLLGAGLVFWVAANWALHTRSFKLHVLQAAVLLPVVLAVCWPRVRTAGLLLATLALGGLLAFVGQTYQTGADAWQLFATWAALALPWMLAARRDALWAMWLLILGLALSLWWGPALLSPLMAPWGASAIRGWGLPLGWVLAWALVLALPLALPRLRLLPRGARAAPISWRLAALMALSAWVSLGILALFADQALARWVLAVLPVLATLLLARWWRPLDIVVLGLAVLALNVLLIGGLARALLESGGHGMDGGALLLVLTVGAAVCVGTSATWLYRVQRTEGAGHG